MPSHVATHEPPTLDHSGSGRAVDFTSAGSDLERRRELGQFFTPPAVAGFVWDVLEVIHGRRFPHKTRVIDPACGEGVFLQMALERGKLAPGCLYGADIDEMLAAVWHHDSRLKAAHLLLANGLLDLPDRGIQSGAFDVVVGNPPFAGRGLRDLLRLMDDPDAALATPETDLFGALVLQERAAPAGPPLKPQERAKLDQLAKQLGPYLCWRLTKDTENGEAEAVGATSSGEWFASSEDRRKNGSTEFARAAEMVAAWPLNRPLDTRKPESRLLLRRLASTAIEVFFMERFLRLAKPGGLIAVIVPESIVASDQLGPLRTWLLTEMDLLAVVSLPQKVFVGVGANARTSIVFARRRLRPKTEDEQAAELSDDARADSKEKTASSKVFMAALNAGFPDYTVGNYLADVLKNAREWATDFSSNNAQE